MENEYKIEIFVPHTHLNGLLDSLGEAGIGRIGNYDHCSTAYPVRGFWRPLEGASPYDGEIGKISTGEEYKVEVKCKESQVKLAIKTIRKAHPYEEPVINIISLANADFEHR